MVTDQKKKRKQPKRNTKLNKPQKPKPKLGYDPDAQDSDAEEPEPPQLLNYNKAMAWEPEEVCQYLARSVPRLDGAHLEQFKRELISGRNLLNMDNWLGIAETFNLPYGIAIDIYQAAEYLRRINNGFT